MSRHLCDTSSSSTTDTSSSWRPRPDQHIGGGADGGADGRTHAVAVCVCCRKNGTKLRTAFRHVNVEQLYPTVGLHRCAADTGLCQPAARQ